MLQRGGGVVAALAAWDGKLRSASRVAFLALATAFAATILASTAVQAKPNLEGVTGILNIPTAEVLKDGEACFGFGRNENRTRWPGQTQRNYFAGIGYLPHLEVCARYTEFPGVAQTRVPGYGAYKDRSANLKLQFLAEPSAPFSLAAGVFDVGGQARLQRALYGALTKTAGPVKLTAGYGNRRIEGFFGGVEITPLKEASLLYEYDSCQHNFGVRVSPGGHFNLLLASADRDFTFGISCSYGLQHSGKRLAKNDARLTRDPVAVECSVDSLDALAAKLARAGFENVEAKSAGDILTLKYENRLDRMEEEAWAWVLVWAAINAPADIAELRLVARREGNFILNTECSIGDLLAFANGELSRNEFARRVRIFDYQPPDYEFDYESALHQRAAGSTDIHISPANKLDLGRPYAPVKQRSGIAIKHETSLGRHFTLRGHEEIPLTNNLDRRDPPVPFVRGASIDLYATGGEALYFLGSGGYFDDHRWGVKGELRKYFADSRFDLGVIGARVRDKKFGDYLNELLGSGSIRIPRYDLTLSAYGGRFLLGDDGWRAETRRYFGRSEVDFYIYDTEFTRTEGGVRFVLPLAGYNQKDYSPVRISLAPFFSYEYRSRGYGGGDFLAWTSSVESFRKRLFPWYLREHLELIEAVAKGMPR
ncbi:MAG: hypothetical protein B1H03_00360 [Planctomycetales bacterium 4484_113]|nr:MAG: hypothetical protein B1H03_00360 [Planctomycetales bacterium 4484_113]